MPREARVFQLRHILLDPRIRPTRCQRGELCWVNQRCDALSRRERCRRQPDRAEEEDEREQ